MNLILALIAFGTAYGVFVNELVTRQVWINSLVVRTDVTVHYKGATGLYIFGIEEERVKDLAYISFYDAKTVKDLPFRKLSSCGSEATGRICWEINVSQNGEGQLGIKMANVNALESHPKIVKLEDPFRLKYAFNSLFWSPYATKKQEIIIEYAIIP